MPEERPTTPPSAITITASNGDSITMPLATPANVKEVNQLVEQIKAGNHDPMLSEKLGKAYSLVLTKNIMLRVTNNELINVDHRKKERVTRRGDHWGEARIMNMDIIQKRDERFMLGQLEKELKRMGNLGPNLFEEVVRGSRSPVKKKSPVKNKTITPPTLTLAPPPVWRPPPELPEPSESPKSQSGGKKTAAKKTATKKTAAKGGKKTATKEVIKTAAKGGRKVDEGGKKVVAKEIVEEIEEVKKFTRNGRQIKPPRS